MLKKIIKFSRPVIIFSAQAYWFIFRPKTRGVKIILINSNQILFVKPTYGYKYTLPGGGLKKDENPEEGIKREVQEELGIILDTPTYLGSFISTVEYKKDEVFAYFVELKDRDISIDNLEIEKADWFSFDNLPKIGPVTGNIIGLYKNRF